MSCDCCVFTRLVYRCHGNWAKVRCFFRRVQARRSNRRVRVMALLHVAPRTAFTNAVLSEYHSDGRYVRQRRHISPIDSGDFDGTPAFGGGYRSFVGFYYLQMRGTPPRVRGYYCAHPNHRVRMEFGPAIISPPGKCESFAPNLYRPCRSIAPAVINRGARPPWLAPLIDV